MALGIQVGRNKAASACMDTSDGLADALRQLAGASGVGVRVDDVRRAGGPCRGRAVACARTGDANALTWSGGEDYELLFAVPRRARRRFLHATGRKGLPPMTRIGVCTKEADCLIVHADGREIAAAGRVRALLIGRRCRRRSYPRGGCVMLLTRSLRRRIVVAAGAALGFVLLYESPIFDSRVHAERLPTDRAVRDAGDATGPAGSRRTSRRRRQG